MEIEAETLKVVLFNAHSQSLCEDFRVKLLDGRDVPAALPHGDNMPEHRIRGPKAADNRIKDQKKIRLWCCEAAEGRMVPRRIRGWSDGRRNMVHQAYMTGPMALVVEKVY